MFGGNPEDATPLDGSFVDIADKHYQRQPHPAWQNWLREPHAHVERFLVRPETNVAPAMWLRVDILNSNLLSINEHLLHVYDVTSEVVGQRLTWAFHTQINHKLRTPLGLFTGYMEILQYELDHVEPNLQPLLVNSFEAGKRLQNHLLDIFNYVDSFGAAKRGAGFSLAECEPLIRQIASDLSLTEVTFDLPFADSVDLLKLTRHSMNLIFTELLTNAKKFHPQNAPMLQIEGRVSGEEVIFSVMDDGQNLPVSELANIWLPYYQAEKYFSGQVPGTGLGLAKVACLIWEVGGRYHALNCEDGAGVCLKLYVPLLESVLFMAGEPAWERWVANEVG
jgi:K+-sensing histidine kinase KdpD